jgi:exodeoxyribonuclease VII large subunit
MVGTIELDPTGQNLLIRFPYREDLIDVVKTLPARRWDPGQKAWVVPAAHVDTVVATLMGRSFSLDSAVSAMFAGTVPKPPAPPPSSEAAEPPRGSPGRRGRSRRVQRDADQG